MIVNANADFTTHYLIQTQIELQKGRILTTLPYLAKEYEIEFEIYPTTFAATWQNVIHLSIGGNFDGYGSCSPGVWFKNGFMRVHSSIDGNKDFYWDTPSAYPVNQWTKVKISF